MGITKVTAGGLLVAVSVATQQVGLRAQTGLGQDTLQEARILGGPDDFGLLSAFAVVGDRYLLVGDAMGPFHLAVVAIESGKVMTRFGRSGEGPGEFEAPHSISRDPIRADTWWVYDFAGWHWTPVTMGEEAGEWTTGERYALTGLPQVPETPMWTENAGALVHGMFSGFAAVRVSFDPATWQVADWEPVESSQPFTREDIPQEPGLSFLNRSHVARQPNGGRFAIAYQSAKRIEVRNRSNGQLLTMTEAPYDVAASYRLDDAGRFHWNQNNESGYVAAYGADDFFFLLWCGCRDDAEVRPMTIHQFRWNGDFVRELTLSRPILGFAVSSAGDRLWGFLVEGLPYPGIGEWVLPPPSG